MQRNKPPILIDEIQKALELLSYIKEAVDAADGTGSFWLTGSFPGIRALPDDLRAGGYESYIETYIMRDIRDLAQVGDELKFRRFMTACAALTARPVVYADLARMADIDEKTAKTWLSLLASTYLVKVVSPYANNLLKRLNKQPILHFADTGLAAYLTGWDGPVTLERGAMSG